MLKRITFVCLWIGCAVLNSIAQPSMNFQNTIKVTNSITKSIDEYTVFRDERNVNQWYYEPRRFRFAELVVQGQKPQPKVTIVKYQYYDPTADIIKEGGAFMATMVMGARASEEAIMLAELKKVTKNPNARLSCINFKSAGNINLITNDPNFYKDGFSFPTTKGSISNQEMAIDLPLTSFGADIIANSGVSLSGLLTYSAYPPPCGLEVHGNWDNIYSYYEKQTKLGGGLKLFGFQLGGSYDKGKIREELKSNMNMTINEFECPGEPKESTARFDPIIASIKDAVFTNSSVGQLERIKELQAMLKDTVGMTSAVVKKIKEAITNHEASFRIGSSIRDIQQRKRGAIKFSYNKRSYIDRELSIGGYLSLKEYNFTPAELEKYVVEVKAGDWPKAIFGLPQGVSTDLGISNMAITIKYKLPNGEVLMDSRQWKPEFQEGKIVAGKWVDKTGRESPVIQFALLGVNKKIPLDQLEFDATLAVSSSVPNNTMTVNKKIKAFNGTANFDAIEQLVDIIKADVSNLDFSKITNAATDLNSVKVLIKRDEKTISKVITPKMVQGIATLPDVVTFILPKTTSITEASIEFITSDGKKLSWVENGPLQYSEIVLTNVDWKTFE
jgi:hypothetical protein